MRIATKVAINHRWSIVRLKVIRLPGQMVAHDSPRDTSRSNRGTQRVNDTHYYLGSCTNNGRDHITYMDFHPSYSGHIFVGKAAIFPTPPRSTSRFSADADTAECITHNNMHAFIGASGYLNKYSINQNS